ncbi:MAG: ABC transporter ATP-binding protein [Clostridiales bacterium]|nr:ABC transporter ATP-binding protein [Clostridiales bacterium]
MKPFTGILIATLFINLVIVSLNLGNAYVFENLIDSILHSQTVVWLILALLFIILMTGALQIGYGRLIFHLSAGYTQKLKNTMFQVISTCKLKDINRHGEGELISRFNVEVSGVTGFMSGQLPQALFQPLMFLTASVYMLIIDWRIYLLCYAVMPLFLLGINFLSKKSARYTEEYYEHLSDANSMILNSIQNIETIKSFTMLDYFIRSFDRQFQNITRLVFRSEKLDSCQLPLYFFIREYPKIVCLIVGGIFTINDQMTLSQLLVYIQLLAYVNQPFLSLSSIFGSVRRLLVQLRTVDSLLGLPQERLETEDVDADKGDTGAAVEFENVYFRYDEKSEGEEDVRGRYVLSNINMQIGKGQKIALLGESGAGKSTMFSLLCGLYEINEGRLRINGWDPANTGVHQLRSQITYISQTPFLFTGTIRENLLFGRTNVTEEEMMEAARIAEVDSFIQTLLEGYDTLVEEKGRNFSGGQQLRLSIARALIHPADIILMDEPTSALDMNNERNIIDNIYRRFQAYTMIISSHRLSTIQHVDRIFYLSNQTIVEQGTHEELMRLQGKYYQFVMNNNLIG